MSRYLRRSWHRWRWSSTFDGGDDLEEAKTTIARKIQQEADCDDGATRGRDGDEALMTEGWGWGSADFGDEAPLFYLWRLKEITSLAMQGGTYDLSGCWRGIRRSLRWLMALTITTLDLAQRWWIWDAEEAASKDKKSREREIAVLWGPLEIAMTRNRSMCKRRQGPLQALRRAEDASGNGDDDDIEAIWRLMTRRLTRSIIKGLETLGKSLDLCRSKGFGSKRGACSGSRPHRW